MKKLIEVRIWIGDYLKLYESLVPDDQISEDDPRRDAIIDEMRGVVSAKTNKEAAEFVEWWGWNSDQELTGFVVKARRKWARMT